MPETEITLPPDEDAEALEAEAAIRRKEGRSDDPAAMQAALCILLTAGLIILNLRCPDLAAELFSRLKALSAAPDVIPDPIGLLLGWLKDR